MTAQRFKTTEVAALEVLGSVGPALGGTVRLRQLVKNSYGDLGAWWWLSPVENTRVIEPPSFADGLRFQTLATQATWFESELMPLDSTHVLGGFNVTERTAAAVGVKARFVFYDADLALVSSGAQTAQTGATGAYTVPKAAVPAGAVYARLRFDLYRSGGNPTADDYVSLYRITVGNSTSANLDLTIIFDDIWVDILGPTHDVTIEAAELDLGTLTATILDSSLDPSQATLLRKGRPVRFVRLADDAVLFTGEILTARVTYDVDPNTDVSKRARITLTAVDPMTRLANTSRPDGVATIDELPHVLEGCDVPWNCNGNTGHVATTPPVVSSNADAKAVDQVAITRDSELGYAWVSRAGVLNVWDPVTLAAVPGAGPVGILNETVYNPGVAVDFDTDRTINTLTIKYLRTDPATGETGEVTYGPYSDAASVAQWGAHAAEFTVHGMTDDEATLSAYAAAILAANSTPEPRITEVTIPFRTDVELNAWAHLDLYDLVTLANTDLGISEGQRVTRLTHRIEGGKWTLTAGFTVDGSVAQPQVTPSPPPSKGQTLGQLLRPVGEVTMWFGALADIPAGWLRCDGTAIPSDYPDLIALVGPTTPNMVDVFPIGAGTKALGTNGGDPTKLIGVTNLPAIDVRVNADATLGGGGRRVTSVGGTPSNVAGSTVSTFGDGTPLDVVPPWRALHFIIRAR